MPSAQKVSYPCSLLFMTTISSRRDAVDVTKLLLLLLLLLLLHDDLSRALATSASHARVEWGVKARQRVKALSASRICPSVLNAIPRW